MSEAVGPSLRFRLWVGLPLLAVAAAAWYLSAYGLRLSTMSGPSAALPIATMAAVFSSPGPGVVSSFLVVWVVGMVAMMFPAMIPVLSMYWGLMAKREGGVIRFLGPLLFVTGYLSLYALLGLALFGVIFGVFQAGSAFHWPSYSPFGVALVLFLAGGWQVTPLKEKSLSKCISPMGFFMTYTKKGFSGAFRMGARHGVYCVGCCWLYMLVMLALAAMSILSMFLLSGLIIVEKTFVGGATWFKWLSAGAFFVLGVAVLLVPSALSL